MIMIPYMTYHPVYASIINWHATDMRRHSNFDFSDNVLSRQNIPIFIRTDHRPDKIFKNLYSPSIFALIGIWVK